MKISKRKLARAIEIIEAAENRAMACDGPVGSTLAEMTDREFLQLCQLLNKNVLTEKILRAVWLEGQRKLMECW